MSLDPGPTPAGTRRRSLRHPFKEQEEMSPTIAALFLLVAAVIFVVLLGILTAVKRGFNEVIRGLEALEKRLPEP